ncbi:helix-turn-helix domain-containing protein [Terrabacter sp. 2YAF2]|uniref:helix-turn-helix domain-containing protein n=1 Tax=Terrabacter sp. 2YAF2 TaxID=3233026 RepID=UPI003F9B04E7
MKPSANDDYPATPKSPYLTTAELAGLLRTNPETVRYWRHTGYGPLGLKVGRHVLYARADVETWIAKRQAEAEHGSGRA